MAKDFIRSLKRPKKFNTGRSSEALSRDISGPTEFRQIVHVNIDSDTGLITGLPESWNKWLINSNIR